MTSSYSETCQKPSKSSFRSDFEKAFYEMLRQHFASPLHVAVHFGVTERAAYNWWEGSNLPTGMNMARFLLNLPPEATAQLRLVVNNQTPSAFPAPAPARAEKSRGAA